MVRFFAGRKRLIGILYLSYKLRERQKERERVRRDRQRGGETEREGRDRQRKRDGVIVARLHKCMHEYKCKIVFKYYTRLTELT